MQFDNVIGDLTLVFNTPQIDSLVQQCTQLMDKITNLKLLENEESDQSITSPMMVEELKGAYLVNLVFLCFSPEMECEVIHKQNANNKSLGSETDEADFESKYV